MVKLDTSRALALPGVRAVITGHDFPDVMFGSGALRDRRVMARDEVFYIGDPVAAVAADDEVTAQEAIELIEVEYELLESVIDPLEAIEEGSPAVHGDMPSFEGYGFAMGGNNCTLLDADRGDVDRAFLDADHIFEENYRSQPINQGFLEPMACAANVEPDGRLTVWASTPGAVPDQGAAFLGAGYSYLQDQGECHGIGRRLRSKAAPGLRGISRHSGHENRPSG